MANAYGFADVLAACPNLQDSVDNAWANGIGANDQFPVAEYLTSEANRRPITDMVITGKGKVRTVELTYQQRRLESMAKFNQPNPNCQATTKFGDEVATYSFDTSKNFQFEQKVNITDAEKSCGDLAAQVDTAIQALVNVADRTAATIITNQAAVLVGKWGADVPATGTDHGWVDAADRLRLDAWYNAGQTPNAKVYATLRNALDDSGIPEDVFIAGGNALREYFQMMQAGCCQRSGIDLNEVMAQYGYASAHDKRLARALGDDESFLVFAPGAVQVLNFGRATGSNAWGIPSFTGSNYAFIPMASPRLGKVAYDVTLSDTCGVLSIVLTGAVKAIGLPNNLFAAGDEYAGVTGVLGGWLQTCASPACSPASPDAWPSSYSPSSLAGRG